MDRRLVITVTSLLSILLVTFHLSEDVVRGFEPGGLKNIFGILILAIWLFGTLVLAGRVSGYIIILLGSILGLAVPIVHMTGAGMVSQRVIETGGVLFWVWTLITLGLLSTVLFALTAVEIWRIVRSADRQA
jgi:hypothetical protein